MLSWKRKEMLPETGIKLTSNLFLYYTLTVTSSFSLKTPESISKLFSSCASSNPWPYPLWRTFTFLYLVLKILSMIRVCLYSILPQEHSRAPGVLSPPHPTTGAQATPVCTLAQKALYPEPTLQPQENILFNF